VNAPPLSLAARAFGNPVDPPIVAGAGDKKVVRCQQAVAKSLESCFDAHLAQYDGCKKTALKAGGASPAALVPCVGDDPKGTVAKACDSTPKLDKIRTALQKSCLAQGVSLAAAFPACGTDGDVEATHACLVATVPCLTCLTVHTLDAFGSALDCDLFDDNQANDSCVAGP